MEITSIDALKNELLEAERVLYTEYSFEKAEPNYLRCLEIIESAPGMRPQFAALLMSLFTEKEISDEPIAFLMHKLRWPEIRDWVERDLAQMKNPMANGGPLEKIIMAFSENWENKEFYHLFSK